MGAIDIARYADAWLADMQPHLPAIMIDGAKGVGKTHSAQRIARTIIRLDQEGVRTNLAANYERLYSETPPVLLDEWQHLPEVWDRVRRMVDDHIAPGSILLTGSIQSEDPTLHSGAGRIVRMRMRPLSLAERIGRPALVTLADCLQKKIPDKIDGVSPFHFEDYMQEIIRSGFPSIYQASEKSREFLLDSYLENITSREFTTQGIRIKQPGKLLDWMRAYAAATATTTSYSKMLDAATAGEDDKPAKETTIAYREALRSLWLIDDLPLWGEGEDFIGRLKQTPKHYLADPALEARLLDLSLRNLITGTVRTAHDPEYGSIAGRLFESLCIMSLRTYAAAVNARVGYLRTGSGAHEVDFIAQKNQAIVAIEIKLAAAITDADVKHLNWFEDQVGDRVAEKIILYTGERAYRRPTDHVLVIPAALFG
ncbi:MAG: DUF4143 domain-containing protein [Coriobacteriia bacterium]|nr:DUF4143 domain-containing protein [Coriobacteriia bacterium]